MNKKAKQDILVCILIYAFMLFCFWQTFTMKSVSDIMPRLILALAMICNTALLIRCLNQLKQVSAEGYTSISEIKIPILMFFGVVLYALAISFTNYFIATAAMILIFMLIERVKPVWLILAIDGVYLVFIYVLFVMVLKVPLLK